MFAVVVTLEALPDKADELAAALKANAAHSREEADCLKWEWSRHVDDPGKFAIYELYTSREAFLEHKASEHFAEWVAASRPCIASKVAGQYQVEDPDVRS